MMQTFLEEVLAGKASIDSIDDFVEQWHKGDDPRRLHEFLGMTEPEYAEWLVNPEALPRIVLKRILLKSIPE